MKMVLKKLEVNYFVKIAGYNVIVRDIAPVEETYCICQRPYQGEFMLGKCFDFFYV